MSTETKESKVTAEGVVTEPVKTPTEAAPAKVDSVETKAKGEKPVEAAGAKSEKSVEGSSPKATTLKDEDEIPEDAELLTLSASALKKRLQRATNAELKERFGTSDAAAIKKDLEELKTLREEKETARRASLDEKAKLEEDKKKAEERATAAEIRAEEMANERIIEKEEGRVKEIALSHIKPKFWEHAARDFAKHLNSTYTVDQMKGLKDKVIEKWFAEYVKDVNPEYAKAEAQKPEPKKEALDNGANDQERPSIKGSPNMAQKTMKPGQQNSLTAQEARAEAAKSGYRW